MIAGIVLAAGKGTRFGGDKMLHPVRAPSGEALPMGLLSALNLKPWVDEVICVVRAQDKALISLYEQHGFKTHISEHFEQGLSASLVAGVHASGEASMYVLALGDMPFINAKTYEHIRKAIDESDKDKIIQPRFNHKPGHPMVFPKRLKQELLSLQGDVGARSIVKKEMENLITVDVIDQGVHWDLDTQAAIKSRPGLNRAHQ